jgi:3'-5' exoribonuclease
MSVGREARKQNIIHLEPGQRIEDEVYRVAQKDLRTTTSGGLYIHMVLADATGEMLARIWNASQELYDTIPDGGFLRFRGRVESYKGHRQFIVDGMRQVPPNEVNPAEFLPATKVKEILRTIENPWVLKLAAKFINDEAFARAFQRAPAAISNHHAYLGGLLEHTLNLLELAVLICPRYPDVSRDLVLIGVFLHDCGKTAELGYESNFVYTNAGQLVGHITQAVIWITQKIREIEQETGQPFPQDIGDAIVHIVLSHHGRYEYGSPRLPSMAEAFVVHYLDNLDAKLNMVFDAIEHDPDRDGQWTGYLKTLETKIFKPDIMGIRVREE